MGYGTGFAAVQDSIKRASEGGSGGKVGHPIDSPWNANWKKDGEMKVVRFLSDNVVAFPMHTFIATKNGGPKKDFACTTELQGELNRSCYICNNLTKEIKEQDGKTKTIPARPTPKVIGLIVERAVDSDGNVYDVTREMDILEDANKPDGASSKQTVPQISILCQGNAFWDTINGYYTKYKTGIDRDYEITRRGEGLLTKYTIIPNDKDTEYNTAEALWDLYGIPRHGKKDPCEEAVIKWIEDRGTVEYFERYLLGGNTEQADEQVASPPPKQTGFGGLRAQMKEKEQVKAYEPAPF